MEDGVLKSRVASRKQGESLEAGMESVHSDPDGERKRKGSGELVLLAVIV